MSKLLNSEKANAALVIALSGAIAAMVADGPGPLSLGRVASGVLSNPVPRQARSTACGSGAPAEARLLKTERAQSAGVPLPGETSKDNATVRAMYRTLTDGDAPAQAENKGDS